MSVNDVISELRFSVVFVCMHVFVGTHMFLHVEVRGKSSGVFLKF